MQDEPHQQYRESLPDRLQALRTLVSELRAGSAGAEQQIRMMAHSLYGSGATFGLPAISEAARKVEQASSAELLKQIPALVAVLKAVIAGESQGKTVHAAILLVEDDPDCSSLIQSVLSRRFPDYRVDSAHSAARAQELLVNQAYALIILDLVLPDRDGREILREIRMDFQLSTPVLVLTGINKDLVRVECMSLGADKVLHKPFDPDVLGPVIDALIRKNEKAQLTLVPKGKELEGAAPEKGRVKVDLTGMNVLLAEDDQSQANLVRQKLIGEGLGVQHVMNGREAMTALRVKEFSLIILDVKMPLFDGFEVLERVRGELGLKTPVIMLTAMGSEADIIRGYDLGANDYLLKPFNVVQLVARVKSLLK